MQERLRPLAGTVPPSVLELIKFAWTGSAIKLDEAAGQVTVLELAKEHKPDVLVVDPLMNFMSGDTDKQRDMSRAVGFLDLLRSQFGAATIVVHHHGKKAGERIGGHKALGSVARAAWYESHMILEWHGAPQDRLVKLSFELRHAEAPAPMVLKFDGTTGSFQVQTEDTGPVADALAAMRELGGVGVTAKQVAELKRKSESWARKYLDQAAEQGLVVAGDSGRATEFSLPGTPDTRPALVRTEHRRRTGPVRVICHVESLIYPVDAPPHPL